MLGWQIAAALVVATWSFMFTIVILFACKRIACIGLRPSEAKEDLGLDYSIHGSQAWEMPITESFSQSGDSRVALEATANNVDVAPQPQPQPELADEDAAA